MKGKESLQIRFQPLPKEEMSGQCFNCPDQARQKVTWGDKGDEYFALYCGNPVCEDEVRDLIERQSA